MFLPEVWLHRVHVFYFRFRCGKDILGLRTGIRIMSRYRPVLSTVPLTPRQKEKKNNIQKITVQCSVFILPFNATRGFLPRCALPSFQPHKHAKRSAAHPLSPIAVTKYDAVLWIEHWLSTISSIGSGTYEKIFFQRRESNKGRPYESNNSTPVPSMPCTVCTIMSHENVDVGKIPVGEIIR